MHPTQRYAPLTLSHYPALLLICPAGQHSNRRISERRIAREPGRFLCTPLSLHKERRKGVLIITTWPKQGCFKDNERLGCKGTVNAAVVSLLLKKTSIITV